MLSPIMWVCHTMSFVGLLFGRVIGWGAQRRDDHAIGWSMAFAKLWPQTLLGSVLVAALAVAQPSALPYVFVLIAGGLLLAVPLCVLTSRPSVGLALQRLGIGRLPEETAPPPALSRRASSVSALADPGAAEPASAD
jgi:membrane glycosyltransferase